MADISRRLLKTYPPVMAMHSNSQLGRVIDAVARRAISPPAFPQRGIPAASWLGQLIGALARVPMPSQAEDTRGAVSVGRHSIDVQRSGEIRRPATLPRLSAAPPDDVTRCLCHAVHLDEELREYVMHTVVDPHLRAVCPSYGVNLVAVARHAVAARRRHLAQRAALNIIRAIMVLSLGLGIALHSLTITGELLLSCLAIVWAVLSWTLCSNRLKALKAVTRAEPPEEQASPLSAGTEDRLRKLDRANVVVYSDGEGDPFVGSGRRLRYIRISPIDVTRAAQDANGNKRTLAAFDALSLNEYLTKQIPKVGFAGLRARNRLYVRGDFAHHVPGLVPDPFGVPQSVVDSRWVKDGAEHPVPNARTFLCLEQIMSGGQFVVAMYARAWLEQNLLTIESTLYAMPPLQDRYRPTREFVARGVRGAVLDAIISSALRTLPALVGKPISGLRRSGFGARCRKAERKAHRAIKAGHAHDYGARTSLREAVATYDSEDYLEELDALDTANRLSSRLMTCIEEFLDDHGIDTSEFKQRVQLIVNMPLSTTGMVHAGAMVVGGQGNIVMGHGAVNNFSPGSQNR
jgi:hypothetical protein